MAFLITKETQDTPSVGPFCDYPAQALDGTPFMSPNVIVNGKPVPIYDATSFPIISKGVYNTNAEWNFKTESDDKFFNHNA